MAAEQQEDNNSLQHWNELKQQAHSHVLIRPLHRWRQTYTSQNYSQYIQDRDIHTPAFGIMVGCKEVGDNVTHTKKKKKVHVNATEDDCREWTEPGSFLQARRRNRQLHADIHPSFFFFFFYTLLFNCVVSTAPAPGGRFPTASLLLCLSLSLSLSAPVTRRIQGRLVVRFRVRPDVLKEEGDGCWGAVQRSVVEYLLILNSIKIGLVWYVFAI